MASDDGSNSKGTDTAASNPYLSTYLKQHKALKLPRGFLKVPQSKSSAVPSVDSNDRTDYHLPKTKLFTIDNVLSPARCDALIRETSKMGFVPIDFEYPEDYRKCHRVICASHELASFLWSAIIPFLRRRDIEDIRPYGFGNDGVWRPTHLNEAIRFTRYGDGHFFKSHRDGGFTRSNLNRSVYTVMVYLNDPDDATFSGGDTVFYSLGPRAAAKKDDDGDAVTAQSVGSGDTASSAKGDDHHLFLTESEEAAATKIVIRPKKGRCVIFNHDVWHKGEVVHTDGITMCLVLKRLRSRSDIESE